MVDYSEWRETQLAVTGLMLDPLNPRIPESGENLSQRDLLADLLKNDKVFELAKSIVENGYYPVEALIYVEEDGRKYVVEGNRRLAALKLLLSPQSAPDGTTWERRFRALGNRIDTDPLRKVKVIRAPSRDAAAPVIMSKHTQHEVERWTPLMQSKFYRNLVDGGLTIDEIAEQYNVRTSEITDGLRRYVMYQLARSLDLLADVAKTVNNPRAFPITSLERLFKYSKAAAFLGIAFDENKDLVGLISPDEFKKGYAKMVADVATGAVHSRTVNTTGAMDKYLAKFGDDKPDLGKKGKFTADSLLNVPPKPKQPAPAGVVAKKPRPKPKPLALIPEAFSCDVNSQRVNDVFAELQKLPVAQYPNAVALMFRGLLEMGLGQYLDQTNDLAALVQKKRTAAAKKNNSLPANYHPTLTEMLVYVVDKDSNIITNGNLLQALNKFISQRDKLFSIDTLNLFVHNEYFHPNEDDLRRFWVQLQPFFEIILVDETDSGDDGQ